MVSCFIEVTFEQDIFSGILREQEQVPGPGNYFTFFTSGNSHSSLVIKPQTSDRRFQRKPFLPTLKREIT